MYAAIVGRNPLEWRANTLIAVALNDCPGMVSVDFRNFPKLTSAARWRFITRERWPRPRIGQAEAEAQLQDG